MESYDAFVMVHSLRCRTNEYQHTHAIQRPIRKQLIVEALASPSLWKPAPFAWAAAEGGDTKDRSVLSVSGLLGVSIFVPLP